MRKKFTMDNKNTIEQIKSIDKIDSKKVDKESLLKSIEEKRKLLGKIIQK